MDTRYNLPVVANQKSGELKHLTKILLMLSLLSCTVTAKAQLAVGKWRDHFSYYRLYKVCDAGDRIYCSAAGGLFYYDLDDYTVNRMNKTTILNDVGVSVFNYDPTTGNLVVAYNNANVDIVKNDIVVNIGDIKRANIGGNKSINNIAFYNHRAYLACGFGIVVVDLVRHEIMETFYLGQDGTYLNINDIAFTDSLIVAATDDGLLTADKDGRNLNLVSNWSRDTLSLLSGQKIMTLATDNQGSILALACSAASDTTLYREVGALAFVPVTSGNIRNVKFCNGKTVLCKSHDIELYDQQGTLVKRIGDVDWMEMNPNDALLTADGRLWIAHDWASMAVVDADNPQKVTILAPSGPTDDNVYGLVAFDSTLYVCPGGHRTTYAGVYNPSNVYFLKGSEWRALSDPDHIMAGTYDVLQVAVNPKKKGSMLAASWGSGILEIENNRVVNLYNSATTDGALTLFTQGDFSSLFTGGIAFDKNGNAWITNSLVSSDLAVRYSNGQWDNFNTANMVSRDIDQIIWDSINDLKIFWGRENKVFVHDGKSQMAYIDPNNGARLQTSSVSSVVQDHNGNLWLGTNKGIKVIYDLNRVFQNGGAGEASPVTCNNILYNENGITEYLMAYESVTCMAVDGANRKWVGTSTGGLYLISANGQQQIAHFTTANSPLFSDKILTLAVMPWSGELFIGTDKGLQSYRTTATYAFSEPLDNIHAFPNPVRPDFDGLIAIKGFTRNAIVHITDAAGNTVYSTRADGGQAVWNGCTHDGKKVASGVYYVFASAEDGTMRSATKVMIIR